MGEGRERDLPWKVAKGERRMPVRLAPTAAETASTTSRPKRARFSRLPPYWSVRLLETVWKNWSIR